MYRRVRVELLAVVGAVFLVAEADGRQEASGLRLVLTADSMSYVLGQPVNLDVSVVNTSQTPALIPDGADVWEGYVEVLIAFEDGGYKEYKGPGWGLRDVARSGSIAVGRGHAHTTQATILYNHGVETQHLNALRAREIEERFLETGYALATPGRYRIKARLYDRRFVSSIESPPIEITVGEPAGVDREVWEVLKTDPDYGYFIQSGGPRGHPRDPRNTKMAETLEKLANDRPQSRYTEAITRALGNHRAVIEDLRLRGIIAY
jgi:hypothetical protein